MVSKRMILLLATIMVVTGQEAEGLPAELTELFDAAVDCCTIPQERCKRGADSSAFNKRCCYMRQEPCCCGCPYPIMTLPSCSIPYTIINGTCYLDHCPKPFSSEFMYNASNNTAINPTDPPANADPATTTAGPAHPVTADDFYPTDASGLDRYPTGASDLDEADVIPETDDATHHFNSATKPTDSDVSQPTSTSNVSIVTPELSNNTANNMTTPKTQETECEVGHCRCPLVNCNTYSDYTEPDCGFSCNCCPMKTDGSRYNTSPTAGICTAGLMRNSGNGKGGNRIASGMNVLAGPSCMDPCCNQNACLMSCSGNGDGGNKVFANANYIYGGHLICRSGNGNGGNCVRSSINLIGGNSARVLSTCDSKLLKNLCHFMTPVSIERPSNIIDDETTHKNKAGNHGVNTSQYVSTPVNGQDQNPISNAHDITTGNHTLNTSQHFFTPGNGQDQNPISDVLNTATGNYTINSTPHSSTPGDGHDQNLTSDAPNTTTYTTQHSSTPGNDQAPTPPTNENTTGNDPINTSQHFSTPGNGQTPTPPTNENTTGNDPISTSQHLSPPGSFRKPSEVGYGTTNHEGTSRVRSLGQREEPWDSVPLIWAGCKYS